MPASLLAFCGISASRHRGLPLLAATLVLLFSVSADIPVLAQSSPYISRVWEYCPAPGQFVNQLPEYEEGDDSNMMRLKAEEAIADNNQGMITLGGWGGYVVFGFDHMIPNVSGEYDFIIYGNAFYSDANGTEQGRRGGSCEPGVVMVSYDSNGNGKPDDEWFELAGSEYGNPQTLHDYSLTYFRPEENHTPTPSKTTPALIDTTYIYWKDNRDTSGYMHQIIYHKQPYFPQWVDADSLVFEGTRLPDNYDDISDNGTYYMLYAYDWGYADNHPNTSMEARLKTDWAVKPDGTPANLPGIHFVKIYTGVHQQCGWLGESSSEITGAEDLHFTTALNTVCETAERTVYTVTGLKTGSTVPSRQGVYILREGTEAKKVIRL